MLKALTDEEIEFLEDLHNPICAAEILFSNYDNLSLMENDRFAHVRLYQYYMLSHEHLVEDDPELDNKENFKRKENVGNLWCYGGRLFGKSLMVEQVDMLIDMLLNENEQVGFASIDAIHIRGIIEKILNALDNHPLFKDMKASIQRSPSYKVTINKTGYDLEGINMNLSGKKPGEQFFQKHLNKLFIEEASFEPEEVYKKRIAAVAENGCIFRIAGMTNFTKHSPSGKVFYDYEKKPWVMNVPSYINTTWDEKEKAKQIKEHGGEFSATYRIFVNGEVVEDAISVFDMSRIRCFYDEKETQIKSFEITKDNYSLFKHLLIVDRPKQADEIWLASDIGESASSKIAIFAKVEGRLKYLYKITLYNLTDKEQYKIFEFLFDTLNVSLCGIDTTEGTARAIFRALEEKYGKEHLIWCSFNEKIAVDFEKDDKGNVLIEEGEPVYKEEFITDWSIKMLKEYLYENIIQLIVDYELDKQLNSVLVMTSANRTIYKCNGGNGDGDHLFATFRVASIMLWSNQFLSVKPTNKKIFDKLGV